MLRVKIITTISMLLFLSSCDLKIQEGLPTYDIISKDFENSILIEGVVEPIQFTTLTCPMNISGTITYLVEDGTYVKEGDVISVIEDLNQQNDYDNIERLIETVSAELTKTEAELELQYALLEAQVKNNEVDTEIANLDSLQSKFVSPTQRRINELELKRAYIEKERLNKRLESLDIINRSKIKSLEINLQRLNVRLQTARDLLDNMTIRAPKEGLATIAQSRITGKKLIPGDNVWSNMPIVIMPEMREMKVKMMVSESDFKFINPDDSVAYTFDAMPGNRGYGKITLKLPVGQPIERGFKLKHFEIEASIDSVSLLPEPGYTTNSRVIVEHLNDTIVVPQIAIFKNDSIKMVYVKKGRKYEMRQIETGLTSLKEAVITEGLQKGETISLIRPSSSLIKGSKLLESNS